MLRCNLLPPPPIILLTTTTTASKPFLLTRLFVASIDNLTVFDAPHFVFLIIPVERPRVSGICANTPHQSPTLIQLIKTSQFDQQTQQLHCEYRSNNLASLALAAMAGVFPWDGRDQEEQAEIRYNAPLRTQNRLLDDENMRLKRLLREHGIPWNDAVASHPGFQSSTRRRRSSRLSALDQATHRLPHLPVEVVLRIMEYALVAKEPIIDPLSKLDHENLTTAEIKRGPQVAINLLSTCRAYNIDGKRIFWSQNTFTFTSPEALRHFADLAFHFRAEVRHITLRIVAKYYDDEKRPHRIDADYHPDILRSQNLRVIPRVREPNSLARSGFVSRNTTSHSPLILLVC